MSGQTAVWGTGSDGDVRAGITLSYTDNGDGTITDNVTGLMWEKKDDSGGIHDRDAVLTKRLVKRPKLYFADVGTVCHLVGLRDVEHAASGPMAGALFENAVVAEVYKTVLHRGHEPRLYFWRTATGSEVDLLIEEAGRLIAVEAKLSATPRPELAAQIHALREDLGERVGQGYVIHSGDLQLPLGNDVLAMPFGAL